MTIVKSDGQPAEPRARLLARYPLTFYFIIALGGTWILWSLFVLSRFDHIARCIVNAHHSSM